MSNSQQQELRQMRCCVYINNQTGRFTSFCTPLETPQQLVCPDRAGNTVLFGATFGTTLPPGQACEGCRSLSQSLNQMNMFNDMTIDIADNL